MEPLSRLTELMTANNEGLAGESTRMLAVRKNLATFLKAWWPLVALLLALMVSFFYGWYFDDSKPISGMGWADQKEIIGAVDRLKLGLLPDDRQIRYPIGYPLLGVIGSVILPSDPFMVVSLALLLSSATLCYVAATSLLGRWLALLFCGLLFYWDGVARTFNYSSELFAVPWSNQVLFFTVAFFFWLLVTKVQDSLSYKTIAAVGLVSGLCVLSREESILFIAPTLVGFLYLSKARARKWLLMFGIVGLCFLPQVVAKLIVNNGSIDTNRRFTYQETMGQYFQPYLLKRNVWEAVIDSNHYGEQRLEHESGDPLFRRGGPDAGRQTLLEASPWLWISPLGILIILISRRYSAGLKLFVLISGLVSLFYMSGVNVSGQKLKFHALRYITPGLIVLNLGVVVAARDSLSAVPVGAAATRRLLKSTSSR